MKDKLHWLAMHGVIRGIAAIGIRRGDLQARLIADPAVATDPVPFYDEVRSHGALVRNRANYLTVDHRLAHDLLRSDDFRVVSFGENLPPPLRWLERRTRGDQLHPLREPSLLAVEPPDHTRYRKTVSAVFTSRAVSALRDLVEQTGHRHGRASAWRPRRPAPRVARSDHRRIHLDRPGWTWLPPLWLRAGAVSR